MTFKEDIPLNRQVIDSILDELKVDLSTATIRKVAQVVAEIEKKLGARYLRMEFGIPGIEPHPIGIEAEIGALRKPRVAGAYPDLVGIRPLKEEGSKFIKNFLNLDVSCEFVIPTVGAMQGTFLSQAIAGRAIEGKDKILFLDPSFAVYRTQIRFLGLREESVDLYDRDQWLDRVDQICKGKDVAAIVFSSPSNPTWLILSEEELKRLGEICNLYDVIAIEDSAYFGMDFRTDYSVPGEPPYPPTIARYCDYYVFILSFSKIFSYAGQRIALTVLSPKLAEREYPGLQKKFGAPRFYDSFVWNGLYCTTSGVAHSAQHGVAALLSKVNRGELNFLRMVSVYGDRAKALKEMMFNHGFSSVYKDEADGFFFTFSYPGLTSGELVRELLYYGVSATTLAISSSTRSEGVRGCSALIGKEDFKLFESRIKVFRKDHPLSENKNGK